MNIRALKGRKQITAAFRRGKRFASQSLIMHVRDRSHAGEHDAPQGGQLDLFVICAVRKKQVPLAISRNRIKRIIRESVRSFCALHPQIPFMTIAFMWQSPMQSPKEATTVDIKPQVHDALHQAMQYFSKH
ncbi:MAG: ribonuclease P protein component [Ignavibacteria bacterium]|nr:ribonuclease P protein component [Ignavibacteria bacterium]